MEKLRNKVILNALGILGILGVTTALVVNGICNEATLILAAIACIPLAKDLKANAAAIRRDTIRILQKALPKAGFTIEQTEWDENHVCARFHGQYRGENFFIEAGHNCSYINVIDLPWTQIKATDAAVPRLMEALNEINSQNTGAKVILTEPNSEGNRQIYTTSTTILPHFEQHCFIEALFCDMLNRKKALTEAFHRERPYLAGTRNTVGFCAPTADSPADAGLDAAAKNDERVND